MIFSIFLLILGIFFGYELIKCCVIVQQNTVVLVSRLGKYSHTLTAGLHFVIPIIESTQTVSLKSTPLALKGYQVITKDNAEVTINVTMNYQVSNPVKFAFSNADSVQSMEFQVRGRVRDIIGSMDLDEVLSSTTTINQKLIANLGEITSSYGIQIETLNVDQITASADVQKGLELQMTASKEKSAAIIKAQGDSKKLEIDTLAQNNARILNAQATKQQTEIAADAAAYQVTKAAEAEANRVKTVNAALDSASANYFENQSIMAFSNAGSHDNLVITPMNTAGEFGQLAAFMRVANRQK